jgi:hypothetical protein
MPYLEVVTYLHSWLVPLQLRQVEYWHSQCSHLRPLMSLLPKMQQLPLPSLPSIDHQLLQFPTPSHLFFSFSPLLVPPLFLWITVVISICVRAPNTITAILLLQASNGYIKTNQYASIAASCVRMIQPLLFFFSFFLVGGGGVCDIFMPNISNEIFLFFFLICFYFWGFQKPYLMCNREFYFQSFAKKKT